MAEEEQRRAVVVAARVAGDLPPLREQLVDRQRRPAAARLDAVSIVARQRPKRMRKSPNAAAPPLGRTISKPSVNAAICCMTAKSIAVSDGSLFEEKCSGRSIPRALFRFQLG